MRLGAHPAAVLLGACLVVACGGPREPFRVALPYAYDSLDPHGDGTLRTHMTPTANIYEPLVEVDAELTLQPGLARSWSTLDDRTWLFELRDATFHSGRRLTSADVVSALRRAAEPKRDTSYYLQDMESVRARDARSVELRTRGPAPRLLNRLGFVPIVPENAGDLATGADGTGPYAVERWDRGRTLTLRRHDGWWKARPDVERAELRLGVGGPEAEAGLLDGRFAAAQLLTGHEPTRLAQSQRHRVVEQEDIYVNYVAWNHARPPFSDRRVRQAFTLAVDRAGLARGLSRRVQPASQLVAPHVFGFDPGLTVPPADVARARALLEVAGRSDGVVVTLTVRERYRELAEELARQLAPAGLKLTVEVEPELRYFERLNRRELALWIDNWGCTTGDAGELFENALHSRAATGPFGRFNESGYSNAELDGRIARAAALDGAERQAALQQLMRSALDDFALLPLYVGVDLYAVDPTYDWRPRADGALRLAEFRRR